ncbi:site-specific integrase [Rhodopseudomonas palustris]|uniref:Site-specific integrase n=1 Tax=Rhodopseudomonas palustris TaxID=1076 RepID=A0AAX3DUC3_RHOPL|nr:site-specific integrase [Rhodopseudomonas palustris]UYO38428.1 site-specific integrase [Rhodopseudomonas palustris]
MCGVTPVKRRAGQPAAERRIPPHRLSFVGFHTLCHTWATWMRRYAGTDLQGLVATGRWRAPRSAARYAHVAAREEWSRVDRLPTPRGKAVES